MRDLDEALTLGGLVSRRKGGRRAEGLRFGTMSKTIQLDGWSIRVSMIVHGGVSFSSTVRIRAF